MVRIPARWRAALSTPARACRPAAASASLCLVLALAPVRAPAETVDQASVHSAYVINFMRYAQWPPPASEEQHYVIVVLGTPPSVAALRLLATRAGSIRGKSVVVRTLALNTTAPARDEALQVLREELGQPHAVYVAGSHGAWNLAVIDAARGRPILTIGVGAEFVENGGMLGLVQDQGRIGFSANKVAIQRASVDVSARVMVLARPLRPRAG